jgi:hypothetical protein
MKPQMNADERRPGNTNTLVTKGAEITGEILEGITGFPLARE